MKILKYILVLFTILFAGLLTTPSHGADYTYKGDTLTITGAIEMLDFQAKFLKTIDKKTFKKIVITSGGGSFNDGIEIGSYVFDNKISVDARDICASTCAYIWLASPHKIISLTDPVIPASLSGILTPLLMIHMPFDPDTGKSSEEGIALAAWYFGAIGLSDKAFLDIVNVRYPSIYVMSPDSTKGWNIGTIEMNNFLPKTENVRPTK